MENILKTVLSAALVVVSVNLCAQQTVQQTLFLNSNGINSTEILMKKTDNVNYFSLFSNDSGFGIYNSSINKTGIYLKADNKVGIGTTDPVQMLDVNGNAVVNGSLASSIAGAEIGGTIQINNPAKTANGAASSWQIFNMGGSYGNSLQFWAYDSTGCTDPSGLCRNRFTLMDNGNVGIGITNPNEKLAVNGLIRAREVKVEATNWPDYVFKPEYKLTSLAEIEREIKEKGHLPDMPSAKEVEANGVALAAMNELLLKKVEELTLHLIEKEKQLNKVNITLEQIKHDAFKGKAEQDKKLQQLTEALAKLVKQN